MSLQSRQKLKRPRPLCPQSRCAAMIS
uniref:Uncharacterized protein n=1 Tax=Anguilla anguilla TaxID=7936 RepID=A0A0E9VL21_ANGAN